MRCCAGLKYCLALDTALEYCFCRSIFEGDFWSFIFDAIFVGAITTKIMGKLGGVVLGARFNFIELEN